MRPFAAAKQEDMRQTSRTRTQAGYFRAAPAFLALLLALAGPNKAGENEKPPTHALKPDVLSKTFCTPPAQPWVISREMAVASKTLRAPDRETFDLQGARSLRIFASREKSGGEVVRLHWFIHSRVGGLYAALAPVNIPPSGSHAVALDVSAESPELAPLGHQRPWDALAASEVLALELRAECSFLPPSESQEPVRLALFQASLDRDRPAAKPAVVVDLSLRAAPADLRAKAVLTFRIEPPPQDPFAAEGEGDVRVGLPGGQEVPAFFDQEYLQVDDGGAKRDVAAGRPYWCAYLPELPAGSVLVILSGARRWRVPLDAAAPAQAPAPRSDMESAADAGPEAGRWQVPLEVPFPEQRLSPSGWPSMWCLSRGGGWEGGEPVKAGGVGRIPQALWRPAPFWNAAWGGFSGVSRPDDALAKRMDSVLARAVLTGQAQPLVVLDGEMFGGQGTFNWDSHPLKAELAGPGELFRSARGVDFCRRCVRYCIARWWASRAVSALWLTATLSTPGSSEFHAQLAPLLQRWTSGLPLPVATLQPVPQPAQTVKVLGSFENGSFSAWQAKAQPGACHSKQVPQGGPGGATCLEVEADNPRSTTLLLETVYVTPVLDWRAEPPDEFTSADALQFEVWAPPGAPPDLRAGVHLRDRDGLWFETLLPQTLYPGDWRTCTLDLTGANTQGLKAAGHKKAWTDYSRQRLTEIGLHIYSTHPNWVPPAAAPGAASAASSGTRAGKPAAPLPLAVRLDNIRAVRLPPGVRPVLPTAISLLEPDKGAPAQLCRGELWECRVNVSKTFANPFDAEQCDLSAVVTTPSGKQVRVPAFFDEPCERREEKPGGAEIVEPVGAEYFAVRYRAVEAGPHKVVFELREGGRYEVVERAWQPDPRFTPDGKAQVATKNRWTQAAYQRYPDGKRLVERVRFAPGAVASTLKLSEPAFVVAPETRPGKGPFHGFVRVAKDKRHFEFEDGTFYYPLGPSLRSPSDNRIPYVDPKWSSTEIARLAKRGTYQYDEYLTECQSAGIDWARVWMCPWWCGLEWRRDWPGYQGCGRYNLLNAWRMDYLLEAAAQRNIFYELCVTNHGQYSLYVDTDWPNNPYNAKLGGPLVAASEFFTRADTQIALQNRLRYVVARYSHSPNIMAWGMLSENEWLEEYEPSISSPVDKAAPNVEAWYNSMTGFLKNLDPNRHLITTHFARPVRGSGILALPVLDYASSNAYSFFEELGGGTYDAAAALADYWAGSTHGFKGFSVYGKPALVGEQGRHWLGGQYSTKEKLDSDLHAGLWGSVVQPIGGATGYWWWLHLHFDKRYGDYKAVAAFMQGEDMRPAKDETLLEPLMLAVTSPESVLRARALASERRMFVWIYHHESPRGQSTADVNGAVLTISELRPGNYSLEFWDTHEGRATEKRDISIGEKGGKAVPVQIPLPTVRNDLAAKMKPR